MWVGRFFVVVGVIKLAPAHDTEAVYSVFHPLKLDTFYTMQTERFYKALFGSFEVGLIDEKRLFIGGDEVVARFGYLVNFDCYHVIKSLSS